jgi:hypothetical protein
MLLEEYEKNRTSEIYVSLVGNNSYNILVENLRGRDYATYLGVDGMTIKQKI